MNTKPLNSFFAWLIVFAICAASAIYIRLYPLRAHLWDPSYEQASALVVAKIKETLMMQIHQQIPSMPPDQANVLATQQLNEVLHKDPNKVRGAIEKASQQIFERSGQRPNVYLLESDPFYYYALTHHVLETGKLADKTKNGKYLNPLMGAPTGYWQPVNYLPYLGASLYRLCHLFNPELPLMTVVAWTPIIFTFLIMAIFLFTCWSLNIGALAAGAGAMMMAASPIFIKRSALGWFDTDPVNILFGLLITTLLIQAFSNKKWPSWLGPIALGITFAVYALFWHGWGFMLGVAICCAGVISGQQILLQKSKGSLRRGIIFIVILILSTIIGIDLFFGLGSFFNLIREAVLELAKFTDKELNIWPNLFMEVGELKKSSLPELVSDTGSIAFFLLAALGLWQAFWSTVRTKNHMHGWLIVGIFLALSTLITLGAMRFAIFWIIPLSLLCALGIEQLLNLIPARFNSIWVSAFLVGILSVYAFNQANAQVRLVLTPIYNQVWDHALIDIRDKTEKNATVTTWWPPGHFIKATSQRKVLFDGASLDEGPIAYWIANALLSSDERQARDYLKMINASRNEAAKFLIKNGFSTADAVSFLKELAGQDNATAYLLCTQKLDAQKATALMALVRRTPDPGYLLLYNEMVEKTIGLTFIGKWNFAKLQEIYQDPELKKKIPPAQSKEFIDFVWSLNGGPSRMSEALPLVDRQGDMLIFKDGIAVNTATHQAIINSPTFGKGTPLSLFYLGNSDVLEQKQADSNLNYSVVLHGNAQEPIVHLMDRSMAQSLLIKLFFFNGTGLKYFSPLDEEEDLTGRTNIKTFKIRWDG